MKNVVLLINAITTNATKDELDVLDEAIVVEKALSSLGYTSQRIFMDLNLNATSQKLINAKPYFVFNLVESLDKDGRLIYFATSLLEHLSIPYSGCRSESMFVTSNKTLTKKMMCSFGLPTPMQIYNIKNQEFNPNIKYIAKPVWEDASVGISDENILSGDISLINDFINKHKEIEYFFEEYVNGREFNISVLGGKNGPEVLPIPEIVFDNFPDNKPKIIGYAAKWDESSFEYKNTNRVFGIEEKEPELAQKLKKLCTNAWNLFDLKGYARIDLRLDESGNPWILEINANPCLSEDAGFYAATIQANYKFPQIIKRIIEDVWD